VKTVLTALDLLASSAEMSRLVGAHVENVYRTAAGFLFKFGQGFVTITRHRVSLTGLIPEKTHEGAETLRGLFRGERLTWVGLPRFDRIVELHFETGKLVVELLEPFNVAAVREGRVVWLLHSYRGKDRELKAGAPYAYPPAAFIDVLRARVEEVAKAIDPSDVRRSLIRRVGTGPELADELIARVGADPHALAAALKKIVEEVAAGRLEPSVCIRGGVAVTVLPIALVATKCDEVKRFDSFWAALDFYFGPLELEVAKASATRELEQRRRRLEASIQELERKIPEYRGEAARLKALAHKLLVYKYEIEQALAGSESSIRVVYVDGTKVKIILPEGNEVEIRRDVQLGRQISALFEKAKELEEKAAKAQAVLDKMKGELAKLVEAQRKAEEKVKSSVKAVVEREWFEKYHWTVTTGKRPVLGGRDASQNESIVRKYLKDHYLFFHADIPGASVVIAPPIEDPLEVHQVAQFAAAYSRAGKIGIHAVDVYYARGEQVSKQPPAGQYLARGSFMVYGKREHVRNVRLELAVGCRRDGEVARVVAAPPKSAPLLAEKYVVVTPGNIEKSRLAKELAEKWGSCNVDEIVAALPGPSRVSEVGKGSPLSWEEIREIFKSW